jgi:hypothetical protein
MAQIIADDLWFCEDCTIAAVNDDYSGMADETAARVQRGLESLGGYAAADSDSESGEGIREFSWSGCDCCGSRLGGSRHRFSLLG